MELFVFQDLLIILGLSVFVLLIGHRLNIPPVVGFILTGVLVGPHGLAMVKEIDEVEKLAEIGIVLLLFGIGMEFSLKKLVQIKRFFLLGGSLQVGLTILVSFLIAQLAGRSIQESILLGFLICMSSTAVVLGLLDQKGESSSPHGKVSIAVLIFQDMIAIPMILMIPLLALKGEGDGFDLSLIWPLLKGILILAIVFVCAQQFVPKLLLQVARTRNKELFLLCVLGLCFGVAFLTSGLGLSLTIGAFLAGLIISESEYSSEAISNIFPFQALFISFFFVSVGMLLNVDFLLEHPFSITGLALAVLLLKIITASAATLLLGFPIRTSILVGLLLSQVGEFSFVLAKTGVANGLGSDFEYQFFLATALFSLILSPILINLSPYIVGFISKIRQLKFLNDEGDKASGQTDGHTVDEHVIIIGFGVSGRHLAKTCKLSGIPYKILEMNPDTVKEEKLAGEPIKFGDATHLSILEHLKLHKAKVVAVLINDPIASRSIVKLVRSVNPDIYIIVRTRFLQEMSLMFKLGADEVISDEFGASVEVFSHVLRQYHVPDQEIYQLVNDIRAGSHDLLKFQQFSSVKLSDVRLDLSHLKTSSFRLKTGSSLIGQTLMESGLRKLYGINVLIVRRQGQVITNPAPDTQFLEHDVLVVAGDNLPLKEAARVFESAFERVDELPATT